jgi:hypothetical protein
MNLTKFWKLNMSERATLLWDKATFVTTAMYFEQRVNLYYLNGIFIEVWYDTQKNQIVKITPMNSIKLFKGYFKWN